MLVVLLKFLVLALTLTCSVYDLSN